MEGTLYIRADGVGVSRSLRMRKVSGSIPDQSTSSTIPTLLTPCHNHTPLPLLHYSQRRAASLPHPHPPVFTDHSASQSSYAHISPHHLSSCSTTLQSFCHHSTLLATFLPHTLYQLHSTQRARVSQRYLSTLSLTAISQNAISQCFTTRHSRRCGPMLWNPT